MRHRFIDIREKSTAKVNGSNYVHVGGEIVPADIEALKRVRDNELENDIEYARMLDICKRGFCSRKPGA